MIKIKETFFNVYEEKLMWIIPVDTLYISSVGEESETSGGDALGETGIKEFLTLRPSLVTSRFGNQQVAALHKEEGGGMVRIPFKVEVCHDELPSDGFGQSFADE